MLPKISTMSEYNKCYNRVIHIINHLNELSPCGVLPYSYPLLKLVQNHKYYINSSNPLQILIAEAIHLLKLIDAYEQNSIQNSSQNNIK